MVNIAVAGVGVWGRNVVRNFQEIENVNLAACYDFDPVSLKWVEESYPEVEVSSDYQAVLKNAKIDAVVVATPPHTHFELAKKALEHEKHVLVEKPLTLNSEHAALLVELARKKNKKLMVGHLLKYHPAIWEMKKRIDAGDIGKIFYIHSQRLGLGRVRRVENVMWCLATHDVYTAIYLVGRYPEKVSAVGRAFLQNGIEDVVFLDLFFGRGVVAHIHASWIDQEKTRKTKVVGERKMIIFDELAPAAGRLKIHDKGISIRRENDNLSFNIREESELLLEVENKQPLKEECLHFVECVVQDKTPFTDGEEGFRVVKVLEAAQKSLEKRETKCLIDVH